MTMDCGEFLAGYTDFRDGDLSGERWAAFAAHLAACGRCARYDHVVRRGTELVRELPELEVSDDFQERLQHRLWHVDEETSYAGRRSSAGAAAATLTVAATIALAAWVPLALRQGPAEPAPVIAAQPSPFPGFERYATAEPAFRKDGLAARLEEVGVQVYPLPYRDLLYGGGTRATLASFAGDIHRD
jgi:hypothetical protein